MRCFRSQHQRRWQRYSRGCFRQALPCISLFSGIGGLELGLRQWAPQASG